MQGMRNDRTCLLCSNFYTPVREAVCGHSFCDDCTQRYLTRNSKCPVCRRDFSFKSSSASDSMVTPRDQEEVVLEEQSSERMELLDSTPSGSAEETNNIEFCRGDILNFKAGFARSHFAVYVGHRRIIHYQKMLGEHIVIEETIEQFWRREGKSHRVSKVKLGPVDGRMHEPFPSDEVVMRARHHLRRAKYNIVFENSEDFANWCKYGVKMSDRVEGVAVAATGGIGIVGGATAGAIVGGAAGSIVPIVGTLFGAAVGAGIGAAAGGGVGVLSSWGTSKIARRLRKDKK